MEDEVEKSKAHLSARQAPEVNQLPFSWFERQQNKTTKLLANSDSVQPVEGRNRKYEYHLKQSAFISHVIVETSGYTNYDRFEIEYDVKGGKTHNEKAVAKDGSLQFDVDEFCTRIAFKPPRKWLTDTTIQSVKVYGFSRKNVKDFIHFAYFVDREKSAALKAIETAKTEAEERIAKADQLAATRESLLSEIRDAEAKSSNLASEIESKKNDLSQTTTELSAVERKISNSEERFERLQSEISVGETRHTKLRTDIEEAETKLQSLKDSIDLFPSEISGFVDQARSDIETYNRYAVGLIAIISALFVWVLSGSFDLSEYVKDHPDVEVTKLLLAKLPLAIVVSAIVAAAYKIARVFIEEQIKINRQKLSLTQISIIAKDVSQSAEHDLNLTKEEIYAGRLSVKMALLGEHIKTFVSADPRELLPERLFGGGGDSKSDRELESESGDSNSKITEENAD